MALTPIYRSLKTNGTSFYAFPGASEDISAAYQNDNYKMYFSKYILLDLPKQNTSGGTNSYPLYFDFANSFETSSDATIGDEDYGVELIESLRNYVANYEVTMKESKLNSTEYYYDNTVLDTPSEKIFWRWCRKLNLISLEPANPGDEYFNNLVEFARNDLNDDTYFPEVLWKEREIIDYSVDNYYESTVTGYIGKLVVQFSVPTNYREGDKFMIQGETNADVTSPSHISRSSVAFNINGTILNVLDMIGATAAIVDVDVDSSISGIYTGTSSLVYHRLVQYIGEINGVNNVQESNRSYSEVYAHIPDHTGQTPDILFRIKSDDNYKPNMYFPILPSQIQPEIVGAESFTNPLVSTPQNYPGNHWGQFDTTYFQYETSTGDSIRRSGNYYGVDGDINTAQIIPNEIDGLTVDFDDTHYVKMNIIGRELTNFDQFNALEVNNQPPTDFEFNAILWYYTIEDIDGNTTTNMYGISFLDNPDNNPVAEEIGLRIPVYRKYVATDTQDGTSYAFSLNLNFDIINENIQDTYNPEAINSLFSFNLYNEAMRRLSLTNESFLNILAQHNDLLQQISDIKQLVYTQADFNIINKKIGYLNSALKLYQTNQIVTTETIEVNYTTTNPPQIQLNNIDRSYSTVENILTTSLYNTSGIIPLNVSVPNNRNFLLNIVNNDSTQYTLPNSDKLAVVLSRDLDYKQSVEIFVYSTDDSTQNKQLEIYIMHDGGNSTQTPVQTQLIPTLDLPVFYNENQQFTNSARNWNKFDFNIDISATFSLVVGDILEVPLTDNANLISNSIQYGDTILLKDFIVGTISYIDFSGQYKIDSVSATSSYIYLDVSNNQDLISYGSASGLPLNFTDPSSYLLANKPYFGLNKGYKFKVTRIREDSEIYATSSINTIDQMYLVERLY